MVDPRARAGICKGAIAVLRTGFALDVHVTQGPAPTGGFLVGLQAGVLKRWALAHRNTGYPKRTSQREYKGGKHRDDDDRRASN